MKSLLQLIKEADYERKPEDEMVKARREHAQQKELEIKRLMAALDSEDEDDPGQIGHAAPAEQEVSDKRMSDVKHGPWGPAPVKKRTELRPQINLKRGDQFPSVRDASEEESSFKLKLPEMEPTPERSTISQMRDDEREKGYGDYKEIDLTDTIKEALAERKQKIDDIRRMDDAHKFFYTIHYNQFFFSNVSFAIKGWKNQRIKHEGLDLLNDLHKKFGVEVAELWYEVKADLEISKERKKPKLEILADMFMSNGRNIKKTAEAVEPNNRHRQIRIEEDLILVDAIISQLEFQSPEEITEDVRNGDLWRGSEILEILTHMGEGAFRAALENIKRRHIHESLSLNLSDMLLEEMDLRITGKEAQEQIRNIAHKWELLVNILSTDDNQIDEKSWPQKVPEIDQAVSKIRDVKQTSRWGDPDAKPEIEKRTKGKQSKQKLAKWSGGMGMPSDDDDWLDQEPKKKTHDPGRKKGPGKMSLDKPYKSAQGKLKRMSNYQRGKK